MLSLEAGKLGHGAAPNLTRQRQCLGAAPVLVSLRRSPLATCQCQSALSAAAAADLAGLGRASSCCSTEPWARACCASQKTRRLETVPSATACAKMAGKEPSGVALVSVCDTASAMGLPACALLAAKYSLCQHAAP